MQTAPDGSTSTISSRTPVPFYFEQITPVIYKCLRDNNINKVSLAINDRETLFYFLIMSYLQITGNVLSGARKKEGDQ